MQNAIIVKPTNVPTKTPRTDVQVFSKMRCLDLLTNIGMAAVKKKKNRTLPKRWSLQPKKSIVLRIQMKGNSECFGTVHERENAIQVEQSISTCNMGGRHGSSLVLL